MPFHLLPQSTDLNRRDFLAGAGATAALAALGAAPRRDDTAGAYLALLSDTHIAANPATVSRQQTMAANLGLVVSQILAQKQPPEGVLVDGDLALKDGQKDDYRTFLNLIEPLSKAKLPIHLALGNHDDRVKFRESIKGVIPAETRVEEKQVSLFEALGLRIVVLDSLDQVNVTPGLLGESQIRWLGKELDAKAATPTLVFLHHNLKAATEAGLTDDEELLAVLRPRKQVKAVIFGHTHYWDVRKSDGIYMINLPAVGYPFAESQPVGWTKLTPKTGGAELELFAVGGNKSKNGEKVELTWR